jgi:hypothetical protein
MLKTAYGEECYGEQVCLNGIKGSKEGSKSENAKIEGENNVDCISGC